VATNIVQCILGNPGADIRGKRQIKQTKLVPAEAWCEKKFSRQAEESLGTYL